MYFVNKENVARGKICKNSRKVALLFNGGTRCYSEINAHLLGNNAGKGGLTKTGRAVEKHVVEGIASAFSRFNVNL